MHALQTEEVIIQILTFLYIMKDTHLELSFEQFAVRASVLPSNRVLQHATCNAGARLSLIS